MTALLSSLLVVAVAALAGGGLARRLGAPAVLGELAAGALAGALGLVHHSPLLDSAGELGLILLLFTLGLESDLDSLRAVGRPAAAVAAAGVVLSLGAGFAGAELFGLGPGMLVALFTGGVLAATSVGVTATVFAELGRADSVEARIVLGAAVADDILGLILLGVAVAVAGGSAVLGPAVALSGVRAVGFVVGAVALGIVLSPRLGPRYARLRPIVRTVVAGGVCAAAAAGAGASGLAPFVGGFVGGVVVPDTPHGLAAIRKAARLTAPVFFVVLGSRVDLSAFTHAGPALATVGIAALGIAAKAASGLVAGRRADRWAVGIGMVPRGEVGLVFAATGLAAGVLGASSYAVLVGAVILTTLAGPLLLGRRLAAGRSQDVRGGAAVSGALGARAQEGRDHGDEHDRSDREGVGGLPALGSVDDVSEDVEDEPHARAG